mmetsp:Transcript_5180/g.10449  ORF Transcript_5180/g.10449 Transcript_5180/m.10449 type:complete len:135 (-) Transcript_5180:3253-3657(-)
MLTVFGHSHFESNLGESHIYYEIVPRTNGNEVHDHQHEKNYAEGHGHDGGIEIVVDGLRFGARDEADSVFIIAIQTPDAAELRGGESGSEVEHSPEDEEEDEDVVAEPVCPEGISEVVCSSGTNILVPSDNENN